MDERRVRVLRGGDGGSGPVVLWMSRDQRVRDNWALVHAGEVAREMARPLVAVFCLVPEFLGATARQFGFMLRGLRETGESLGALNIPLVLLEGDPGEMVSEFARRERAALIVTDFDPLRIKRGWKDAVARAAPCPLHEVDAHNVIPCWVASGKREYAAATFRPKVRRLLREFLAEFPRPRRHPHTWGRGVKPVLWERLIERHGADRSVGEVRWIVPGERVARRALRSFIRDRLASYASARNDPTLRGQSGLSPYLHFGHLSAQRIALEVMKAARGESADAFLEELIVRRELSDNFCLYTPGYDSVEGFPDWARRTLLDHEADPREHLYSARQLEDAATHDPLWNAAQREMVLTGKMHGYMRMYWAKKILEWSPSPAEAMERAVFLNDRYELDGRDPNGYTGIAWSIGGVHDRAWGERPVFGKVRYMSYNGCRSKFDVARYIDQVARL